MSTSSLYELMRLGKEAEKTLGNTGTPTLLISSTGDPLVDNKVNEHLIIGKENIKHLNIESNTHSILNDNVGGVYSDIIKHLNGDG